MAHAAAVTPATEVRVNRFLAQVYLIMSLGLVVTALVATWVLLRTKQGNWIFGAGGDANAAGSDSSTIARRRSDGLSVET